MENKRVSIKTLPGDDLRQIMWRYSDRYDLQMIIQSTRPVARGPVAQAVANGQRNTHEWTREKQDLFQHFDTAGITSAFMNTEEGGFTDGPKNFILAMIAYELSWVDAGAATASLAGNLALEPIKECGTKEQKLEYMGGAVPGKTEEIKRGAFALTEPLPYVGVDTGILCGKVSVESWEEGGEPMLRVEKRGRFITNMAGANFVTAAVETSDERIKTSCMIILDKKDKGNWDTGSPTLKMVHQLSATNDPILNLVVPAHRIIGGYTVKDGRIIPNYSHGHVIDAVFKRTRVTVGVMTAAKLLSAIEPVMRYHRKRFQGGEHAKPGTPRYEHGIQQKEDARQRLIDVWATGEAAASLGFATARLFDAYDEIELEKNRLLAEKGIHGARAEMREMRQYDEAALTLIDQEHLPEAERDKSKYEQLQQNTIAQYIVRDAVANVLCPACKLWNTGYGANMMREAVSLMGGYGITEDCPGYLGQKWMDAQLEANYEGPEVVQRRQLTVVMTNKYFLKQFTYWISELKNTEKEDPGMGASALAAAMELWLWTLDYLRTNKDPLGDKLYKSNRDGVTYTMADALCWLLASRYQILDIIELKQKGPANPVIQEGLEGYVNFFSDMCFAQAGKAAGEVSRIASELIYGFTDDAGSITDIEKFQSLKQAVDQKLCGARLAKDRASRDVAAIMIPEALDYPQ
ncbi:MAG TPA: acyl-CoA dehydrogenase family protein [Spirochaetota bacterium]|nr:acyl-CoA dehydrogenase family protein [Spirochaetota bacterium]